MKLISTKSLVTLLKFVVSIGILVMIMRGRDLWSLKADLLAAKPSMLALVVLLLFAQTFLLCHRWILILRAMGVSLDWLAGWRILIVSTFFNQIMPAGGDAVRIWMLRRHGEQWSKTISSIVADRFLALLALVAVTLAGMPFLLPRINDSSLLFVIVTVLAFTCIGVIALVTLNWWPPRLIAVLPATAVRFVMLIRAPLLATEGRCMLITSAIIIHLMTVAACYVLSIGLDAQLSALDAFVLVPLVILSSAVPISIGGWGVREGAMVAALSLTGVASEKALAISVLLGLGGLIVGLFGGLVWLFAPERANFKTDKLQAIAERADAARI
ncbi:lysylphosphatidylglycerol synthase transmembrane domain-containing protein [Bradyrhizobium sp. SSUT112]|uniref:lysylphosphatidylglycerol synthase transmembrane domain-containing protein n=1 Tax=Bradyrhizobium sp. SSUT112 TaxID=3040604 RepID=UPI002446F521|nr:lysylphosphatidylglycerol synthase transmembrane domain-containing protein [Bradyrhizobium sp. SSUT112]MDH2351744.1 lysylphosphatidylglycerol synthase transmembrane domain-containing protein [Bradyrhizobium sp. SSUT112]